MSIQDGPDLTLGPPDRGDWLVAAGYLAVILTTYLLGVVAGTLTAGELAVHPTVYQPILFPGLFLFAPPLVAVFNRQRGGTVVGTLVVGLAPGAAFAILGILATVLGTTGGDSPLWVVTAIYTGYGVLGAMAGMGAEYLVAVVVELLN